MQDARVTNNRIIVQDGDKPTSNWVTYATLRSNQEAREVMALIDGRLLNDLGY